MLVLGLVLMLGLGLMLGLSLGFKLRLRLGLRLVFSNFSFNVVFAINFSSTIRIHNKKKFGQKHGLG